MGCLMTYCYIMKSIDLKIHISGFYWLAEPINRLTSFYLSTPILGDLVRESIEISLFSLFVY